MKDEEVLEASIVLPASLFQQLEDQEVVLPHNTQYIVVTMFKNNKFFPVDENRRKQEDVTSNVAGVKLSEFVEILLLSQNDNQKQYCYQNLRFFLMFLLAYL